MIHAIIDTLNVTLGALNWVDTVSGLTVAAPRTVTTKDGEEEQALPLAYNQDPEDCYNSGTWKALVPDGSKTSFLFWTLTSDITYAEGNLAKRRQIATAPVRLHVWANMNIIDLDAGEEKRLIGSLRRALKDLKRVNMLSPYATRVWVRSGNTIVDYLDAFAPFDYVKYQYIFRYPYVGFAIDVELQWIFNEDCDIPIELKHQIAFGAEDICFDGDPVIWTE